jgi:ankyrin repeat protein
MASASLLRAVENGDVAAVDEELFLGDRADNVNRDGDGALHKASAAGRREVVAFLLEKGATSLRRRRHSHAHAR